MTRRNNNFEFYPVDNTKYLFLRSIVFILLILVFFAANINSVIAQQTPNLTKPKIIVPEKITGVFTVAAEQVIKSLTSDTPPILIDARIRKDREYGYIESSISLPDIETNCAALNKINPDKNKHLIFYCNGVQCGRSVVSIKVARSCGHQNLSWFKGGFAEWNKKGYQYIKSP